jgi:hypothetical protein
VEFHRRQGESTVAVACDWPFHRESARVRRWHSEGGRVSATPRLARPLWHQVLLHRQSECLSAASPIRATHGGKLTMQKIERKHLTLRPRLKRLARTSQCFSRSRVMHDLMIIGLYMGRVELGVRSKKSTYQIGTLPRAAPRDI